MSSDSTTAGNWILAAWAIATLVEMGLFVYASRRWLVLLMEAGEANEFERTSSRRIKMRQDLVEDWLSSPRSLVRGQPKVVAKYFRLLVRTRKAGTEEESWRRRAVRALISVPVSAAAVLLLMVVGLD